MTKRKAIILVVVVIIVGLGIVALAKFGGEGGGQQAPRETTPPEIWISWDPFSPQHGDYITFEAWADDESGIADITLVVDGEIVKRCEPHSEQTSLDCSDIEGPYSQGQTVEFYAVAFDFQGNRARSHTQTLLIGQ